jgi:RNA recognition motif-containing protein
MSADDARKLFVGGLADTVGDAELRAFFEAGNFSVEHVAVPRDRDTGKPRGFAFVTLISEAEATRASQTLNNSMCGGRPLRIRPFSQEGPKRSGPDEPRTRRAPDASLFLGKLPYDVTPEEVTELFATRGVVVQRVTLPLGPDGRPRGFGFASVESEAAAEDAVLKLADLTLKGRAIVVSRAQAKGARPDGAPPGRTEDRGSVPPPRFRDPGAPPPAREFVEESADAAQRARPERQPVKRPDKQKRSNLAPQRGQRRERGGGGSWQKWDDDDE